MQLDCICNCNVIFILPPGYSCARIRKEYHSSNAAHSTLRQGGGKPDYKLKADDKLVARAQAPASQRNSLFRRQLSCARNHLGIWKPFKHIFFLGVWAVAVFCGPHSWAESGGRVSGTVKDTSNAIVRNASVTAKNLDTGVEIGVATNGSGFYSFPDLPVGKYNISVE